jgi:hypothetical protein
MIFCVSTVSAADPQGLPKESQLLPTEALVSEWTLQRHMKRLRLLVLQSEPNQIIVIKVLKQDYSFIEK